MKKLLIASAVLAPISSPALAGNPYVGVEVGVVNNRASDIDETITFSSSPANPGDPNTVFYDDVFSSRWERGRDLGLTGGYDFGWFRVEGELAHKKVGIDHIADDDITAEFLGDLNSALNRPSAAPDPGAPGLAPLTLEDFQRSGSIKVGSAMVNAILDVKIINRVNVFAGVGYGLAFAHGFHDDDNTSVWQRIFGARVGLTDQFDLGVKYRNFRTGVIKLDDNATTFAGNPNQVVIGNAPVIQTTTVSEVPDLEGQFRAKSLLVSLTYNLR